MRGSCAGDLFTLQCKGKCAENLDNLWMKRAFDFIASSLGIIVFLPLLGMLAFLIKCSDKGPIIFRQNRVGLAGRTFRVFKFRTMLKHAAAMGTSVTASNDPRITRIGRILRRTKMDELPQLINVLKGDMSLVGPRPDVQEIVDRYSPDMRQILSIKPGITSVATLHLRDEEGILASVSDPDSFYEEVLAPLKVRLAMEHVERGSFWFDMKVLFQTLWMLSLGRLWPIQAHPEMMELKKKIVQDQAARIDIRESMETTAYEREISPRTK